MDKVFFKIVIPNYNSMVYIKQCLDSIAEQTFRDFMVIFVDDLSTDLSMKFAEMYARKYPDNFTVISAGKKRYAGGCRNFGIDYPIDCEYYYFMDSDDYLRDKNALMKLYNAAKDLKTDFFIFNWAQDREGVVTDRHLSDFEIYRYRLANCPWCATWSRIVRSDKIERFLEAGCMFGEDTYQLLKLCEKTDNWKQLQDVIYVYRSNPTSCVHTEGGRHSKSKMYFYGKILELKSTTQNESVRVSIENRLARSGVLK
jgi:glycosyltransferase involved in cell wall biosynthesis